MSLIEVKGRGVVGGDPTYEAPRAGAWHQRKASKNKPNMVVFVFDHVGDGEVALVVVVVMLLL